MMMKKCLRDLPMLSQMLTHTVTADTFLVRHIRIMIVINKFATMMMFKMIMVHKLS